MTLAHIWYVTDPTCSHCWGMEPAWRKLLFHYGEHIDYRYIYGGLREDLQAYIDSGYGFPSVAALARHWREVEQHYGQPLNTTVWETDVVQSSYPSCIAALTVRLVAPEKEDAYMRRMRQALFLEGRSISRPEVLADCAADVGLDREEFSSMLKNNVGKASFEQDLLATRQLGVTGFPTVIMIDAEQRGMMLPGGQPFHNLEAALLQTYAFPRSENRASIDDALQIYQSGTTKEFADAVGLSNIETEAALEKAGARCQDLGGKALWFAK